MFESSRRRIILADDHALLLDAFTKLLEPHFEIVGTAVDGRELVKLASKLKPDVIVSDISMPLLNGLDAAAKIKNLQPDIKFVFLTVNEDPDLVAEAFRLGGNGYLLKSSASTELFKAIEVVVNGGKYVTPLITGAMIGSMLQTPSERNKQHVLTTRQREILQLLAEGKTMKEAANILCVTSRTVAFHKYRIMEDLGIKTNSELIHYAIKHGLISI
ncbi:MAG: DNA-binding NarL/FixJ family response regulator [Lysobacterales bacterium]|jgi:DNA-binding NarL/FixJ family response regulator